MLLSTAEGLELEVVEEWTADELFPRQHWPTVVGRRRGLLVSAGDQPWGGSVLWGRNLDLSDDRTEYRFYAEGSSAYAVYFHSPEEHGYNPMPSWHALHESGATQVLPVAMFLYDTENPWGLHRRAHLVEVDALGPTSPANALHFVIKTLRVLDGTPTYPPWISDVLQHLRARFDSALSGQDGEIEALLAAHRREIPDDWDQHDSDGPQIVAFPTWIDAENVLAVTFFARYRETAEGPEQVRRTECPRCPCHPQHGCAPCARCVPGEERYRPSRSIGWEFAVNYRIDRNGRLGRETVYGVHRR